VPAYAVLALARPFTPESPLGAGAAPNKANALLLAEDILPVRIKLIKGLFVGCDSGVSGAET
jgi:hypothetical protein